MFDRLKSTLATRARELKTGPVREGGERPAGPAPGDPPRAPERAPAPAKPAPAAAHSPPPAFSPASARGAPVPPPLVSRYAAEEQPQEQPEEQACPNCGQPMLAGWGTTCGKCKPKLASPKTAMLAATDLAGATSVTLGWLVVTQSPDGKQRGTLVELSDAVVVLSRTGGGGGPGGARVVEIQDSFMSGGHAVVRRPEGSSPQGTFTIADRKDPGPSANGTFVNSRKLGPGETASLGDGDTVRVGITELLFKSLWLPPASSRRG